MAIIAKYTKNTIMIRNLFNNWCSKKLKGHEPMFRYFYICYWYSKKEYNDGKYNIQTDINNIRDLMDYYSQTSKYFLIRKICELLFQTINKYSWKFEKIWIKKNHLVDYGDKESYRILSPAIHDDLQNMYKGDLIHYIYLLEKYGKKELESWGFEKRPPKKLGKLKKLWYDLTLKVY
jgi:hypothetical protein